MKKLPDAGSFFAVYEIAKKSSAADADEARIDDAFRMQGQALPAFLPKKISLSICSIRIAIAFAPC